jgi:predicted nucleic acid-binding protein
VRVFIDSDILLDAVLLRNPHCIFAIKLLSLDDIDLCTSAHCLLNVYYHTRKSVGQEASKSKITLLEENLIILATDKEAIAKAFRSQFSDMEDAVQYYTALKNKCQAVITRNIKDFKLSELPVMSAEQFLRSI